MTAIIEDDDKQYEEFRKKWMKIRKKMDMNNEGEER
jgi:hypothetical protein